MESNMSNWRRDLVEDIISTMLPEIFSDILDRKKIRPIHIDVQFESLPDGIKGYCGIEDDGEYIISMGRNQNKEELIVNMCHELIHVMQVERGDKFDYSKPYSQQTHEIEAYNKQEIYSEIYNLNKVWSE